MKFDLPVVEQRKCYYWASNQIKWKYNIEVMLHISLKSGEKNIFGVQGLSALSGAKRSAKAAQHLTQTEWREKVFGLWRRAANALKQIKLVLVVWLWLYANDIMKLLSIQNVYVISPVTHNCTALHYQSRACRQTCAGSLFNSWMHKCSGTDYTALHCTSRTIITYK